MEKMHICENIVDKLGYEQNCSAMENVRIRKILVQLNIRRIYEVALNMSFQKTMPIVKIFGVRRIFL